MKINTRQGTRYKHNCKSCVYLGNTVRRGTHFDLYACEVEGTHGMLTARYSDKPGCAHRVPINQIGRGRNEKVQPDDPGYDMAQAAIEAFHRAVMCHFIQT